MAQNNLGNALRAQASRTQRTEGTALLAQAVSAYRLALEVRTKKDLPQPWAETPRTTGAALWDQAGLTPWDRGHGAAFPGRHRLPLGVRGLYEKRPTVGLGGTRTTLGIALRGPSEPDTQRDRGHSAAFPGRHCLPLGARGPNETRPAAGLGSDPEQLGHWYA